MDAAYRIRTATGADIESVAELERSIPSAPHWAAADYLGALPPANPEPEVAGTRRCFYVAVAGGEVVGFAIARATVLETEVKAEIESVAVADSNRRAGIGRALCEVVIGWARAQGAAEIELEVRSRSDGPISLYKTLGFVIVGARPKYYRGPADDAVLMRLELRRE